MTLYYNNIACPILKIVITEKNKCYQVYFVEILYKFETLVIGFSIIRKDKWIAKIYDCDGVIGKLKNLYEIYDQYEIIENMPISIEEFENYKWVS